MLSNSINGKSGLNSDSSARTHRHEKTGALMNWRRDVSGNLSILAGFSLLPIFLCAGMAVDYGHASLIKSRLQTVLDSAVLAGGREFQVTSDAAKAEIATRGFFTYRFAAGAGNGQPQITELAIDPAAYTITATAATNIPAPFLRLAGVPTIPVRARSSSGLSTEKDLEVAMVLDITGSMNEASGSGNSKIHDARLAAKDLVDIILPTGFVGNDQTRIALVPFSQYVNVGPYYQDVTDQAASGGNTCVTERTGDDAFTDKGPNSNRWIGAFMAASNHGTNNCAPAAEITPLTNDKQALKDKISDYTAAGWTAGHLGAAWGWYTLSHDWLNVWPIESRPKPANNNVRKIVVLMTDGDYNTYYRNGMDAQAQAAALCTAMKADVTVYTIGFGTGMSQTAKDALKACATSQTHYFDAQNGSQLRDAFRTIAISLTQLRLTQ